MRRERLRRLIVVTAVAVTSGCGDDEPLGEPGAPFTESCTAPDLDHPTRFVDCSTGSGSFGRWMRDARGLVAYDYRLDQHADARASYPVTERDPEGNPEDRRTHWAAFGNRRVNAMFVNDGYVEVATQDRGVELLNAFDADQQSFAGGFGWLDDGSAVWTTAHAWRPAGARSGRRFGMGWAESLLEHRELRVTRTLASPPGLAPVVIADVVIENRSERGRRISHYEYWDVGRRPIEINWLVSGQAISSAPETARQQRDARNALFEESVTYVPEARRLELLRSYVGAQPRPPSQQPSATDYHPGEPFLAQLVGEPADVFVDQASFFGDGALAAPHAVVARAPGAGVAGGALSQQNGAGQPHAFVMRSDLYLAPGESRALRYAYGYTRSGEPFSLSPEWSEPSYSARAEYSDDLAGHLLYFASDEHPILHRELAWHAYQLQASVGWRDYWQGAVVPQGSAYLYLHGADGAARDLGLFAVPLVYIDPELARAEIRLYTGMQHAADERFSYAFQGHGMLDGAGIHSAPSDLGLFFLWALGEYLGATGDLAFLDENAPYYPREARPDATVWSHLVGALRHQFDVIGTGEHGLIRIQTGDWSDGIVPKLGPLAELAVEKGESIPNTQMAIAVLPPIAEIVEARDAALGAEIRARIAGYRQALAQTWTGELFPRAYFGDGVPVHADSIDLEAQVWALIGDSFEHPAQRELLISRIAADLDDPSPIGATLRPGGDVWPAISGLLTWGYARSDPDRAWAHLAKNTLTARALAFPDVWYGIWSGPDGVSPKTGLTWASQVTPMTDFPVQNNNQHALPLLAALRVAGIEATARGLRISPRVPTRRFTLVTKLVELAERETASGSTLTGTYRPTGSSPRVIRIEARPGERIASAALDGIPVSIAADATSIELPRKSGSTSFEIELTSR
jgi:hypothetical protein